MFVDIEMISAIADDFTRKPRPVRILKQKIRSLDPDTVYDWINPDHTIHTGMALPCDLIFYGMIKALSKKYDRIPKDKYDRWPSISLNEFEDTTSGWIRRSQYIGNSLAYWLNNLKKKRLLRICEYDGVIYLAFSKKAVFLILRAVGFNTDKKFISY